MATGLTMLIEIYLHYIYIFLYTLSIIASKIMKKVVQKNRRKAQKVRSNQYQLGQEAQVPVLP